MRKERFHLRIVIDDLKFQSSLTRIARGPRIAQIPAIQECCALLSMFRAVRCASRSHLPPRAICKSGRQRPNVSRYGKAGLRR